MADTPVRIITSGSLGRALGRTEWDLHLSTPSPAEAIRAINVNTGGKLREYLNGQGAKRFYKIALGRKDNLLSREEVAIPTGRQTIYILPTVRGREKAGTKIFAAIAIAVIATVLFGPAGLMASKTALFVSYSAAASLAIGGVVQMLTPVPNFNQSNEAGDGNRSSVFQGNASAAFQGQAVPLIYGRALAPAIPASLSFTAFDKAIVNSFPEQEYDIEYGEGGIVNYIPKALGSNAPLA